MSSGWEDEARGLDDGGDALDVGEEPPELCFPSMLEWFETWLRPMYRRSTLGDQRDWCPQWWQHEEAVSRLDALWRAWETLRLDPGTGLSVWWRDHADHHMAALLDPDGPFKQCGGDEGHQEEDLPMLAHTPPPPELFDEDTPASPSAFDLSNLDGRGASAAVEAAGVRRPAARPEAGRSL